MKRIIMLTMVLVMILVSIGGCYIGWWGEHDRGRGGGGHNRDGGHDRRR